MFLLHSPYVDCSYWHTNEHLLITIYLPSKSTYKLLLYWWCCFLFSDIAVCLLHLFCISLVTLMKFWRRKREEGLVSPFSNLFSSLGHYYREQWLVLIILLMYIFLFLSFSNKLNQQPIPIFHKKEETFPSESKITLSMVLAKGCDMYHHPFSHSGSYYKRQVRALQK